MSVTRRIDDETEGCAAGSVLIARNEVTARRRAPGALAAQRGDGLDETALVFGTDR